MSARRRFSNMFLIMMFSILMPVIYSQNSILSCNENNQYRILQFTDCHFGESAEKDQESVASLRDLIQYEQPDLIALTGDFVSGYAWNGSNGWFRNVFDNAMAPILASNISWSYILGNHDDEADWNRTQIIAYAASLPHSQTYVGPHDIEGVSNYVLSITNSSTGSSNQSAAAFNLWFLDSMDDACYNVSGYGCVGLSAVEWYRQQSKTLQAKFGAIVHGLMFIHIPLPELLNLYNNYDTFGALNDSGVCCWSLDTGLFSALKSRADILGVWHGHDHSNDFYGSYHGIDIGYGRKTAFGSYGPGEDVQRGARVFNVHCSNGTYETWIRQNDGTVIKHQPMQQAGAWSKWTRCCHSDSVRPLPTKL